MNSKTTDKAFVLLCPFNRLIVVYQQQPQLKFENKRSLTRVSSVVSRGQ